MAVTVSNLKFYFSGGAANSKPRRSLGDAISSTEIPQHIMNGLFDRVNEDESDVGATNYRIVYFRNTSAQNAFNVKIFFAEDATNKKRTDAGVLVSPSADDPIVFNNQMSMALYAGNLNATATLLSNENTDVSPTPSYSTAQGSSNSLLIGDMSANDYKAIILRRVITAGTPAKDINHILVSTSAGTGE